mmetsp:Transcript_33343/g.64973  ORF Transcript_33343/g.64973 Transcript_33343/m.64973 type:complete len:464 (+) Transcript_33343:95-1486(+)
MGARLVNKFLYPAPMPPHYECDSHPNHIIWIPHSNKKAAGAIPCLMIRCPGAKNLIIYAHGNGCDIGDMKMELDYFSHTLRAHVCAFELRGYGFNQGTPSEKNICDDIKDVYDYLTDKNPEGKFPHQNIILWGRSIGSGPTTWLASKLAEKKVDVAGLILQSPFTSIKAAAQHIVGNMLGAFLSNRWNNAARIKKIKGPVLIIHGKMDTLIPHSHSEVLMEACGSRNKRLHLSDTADHNRFDFTKDIILPVTKFVDDLCSNSFDWGERVNGKCPNDLYKIPEFAKKMHLKARADKKIREVENPGNDFALGLDDGGAAPSAWRMGVGWEDRLCSQSTTGAEIFKSLLETTPPEKWKENEIIQELKATCDMNQKEMVRRLSTCDEMETVQKLLKANDLLLAVLELYKSGKLPNKEETKSKPHSEPKKSCEVKNSDGTRVQRTASGISVANLQFRPSEQGKKLDKP